MKPRLTPEQVRTIRQRVAAGVSPSRVAHDFGISASAVSQIVRRRMHGAGTVAVTVSPGDLHLLHHLAAEQDRDVADVAGALLADALLSKTLWR